MAEPLLAVAGLRKAYGGVQAVRDAAFTLAAGEILALIGPNGAGKSTCFNMMSGQVPPDAGSVRFLGREVAGLGPRAMAGLGIGRTFQVAAAFASMTVLENVVTACLASAGLSRRLFGTPPAALGQRAARWLERVGLLAEAQRPCAELAYGDLKRLDLAIALAGEPRLLLMDEPTAGMGGQERHALIRFAVDHARANGIGLLFTEHDMDVVFAHADRVIVLSRGAIIARGAPADIQRDPLVRASYLGDGLAATGAAP